MLTQIMLFGARRPASRSGAPKLPIEIAPREGQGCRPAVRTMVGFRNLLAVAHEGIDLLLGKGVSGLDRGAAGEAV